MRFGHGDVRADGQPGKVAIVGHLRIGRVPSFRLDGLELFKNGGAVGIVERDPVSGFEVGLVISVLLGLITVDCFLLTGRNELRFFRAIFF